MGAARAMRCCSSASTNLVLLDLKTMTPKTLVERRRGHRGREIFAGRKMGELRAGVQSVGGEHELEEMRTRSRPVGAEEVLKGQLDWVYPEELEYAAQRTGGRRIRRKSRTTKWMSVR